MQSARQQPLNPTTLSLGNDGQLWLAIMAALPCWAALYLITQPLVQPGWPLRAPWLFISLALLYPIMEEAVFRGLIQQGLHRHLPSLSWYPASLPVSPANLCTSLLFTAFHFTNHTPLWAALVFIPSLIFGYFRDRHRHLAAPILLHAWYNLGYFWIFGAPATG